MSKIPANASPEVQDAFREVWEALRPWLTQNVDLHGRRFMNAGQSVSGTDFLTRTEFDGSIRGLQQDIATIKSKSASEVINSTLGTPKVTTVGQLLYNSATGTIQYSTGSAWVTIASSAQSGLYSAIPSATGLADGQFYYATDQNTLYVVDTSAWVPLSTTGVSAGVYGSRPSVTAADNGKIYYATDQTTSYLVVAGAWVWFSGLMCAALTSLPTLAAGDVGFLYWSTDTADLYQWTGTA